MIILGQRGRIELSYYEENVYREWAVNSYCQNGVMITFSRFDTEYDYDKLTIVDGVSQTEYSGDLGAFQHPKFISNNSFIVAFASDSSITASGFELNWECIVAGKNPEKK